MSRAVLSIGSNLGDRLGYLQLAVDGLADWLVGVSPVFETPPWGVTAQEPFFNAVLIGQDPAATPADWLARAQRCEQAAGRTRELRWGPRTLDVDVIAVDDVLSEDPVGRGPGGRAAGTRQRAQPDPGAAGRRGGRGAAADGSGAAPVNGRASWMLRR
jgi:2-amino-4-hydroxy-6-hydroxymethyldihydropteridine diphosphokinase